MKDRIPPEYEITRDGRVISHKGAKPLEMRQHINGSGYGYPSVYLWRDGKRWHVSVYRLVAAVHLPPRPSPAHELRHLDGNNQNSHADNLAWGTHAENMADTIRHRAARGLTPYLEDNPI